MSTKIEAQTITLGHSPDPDDAFMFYALAKDRIDTGPFRFEHILKDIESLNQMALAQELDVTAVSYHAYPKMSADYALMACGASMGDGYGPLIVAREPQDGIRAGQTVAIPGTLTSAHLALRLYCDAPIDTVIVPFDEIPDAVKDGRADLGVLIHEGQLTYADLGLAKVVDLGVWWKDTTGLPLPLGANAIRRALGAEVMHEVTCLVGASIAYALSHRDEAVEHALSFGRGLDTERTDRFVGMYVNELTIDLGDDGRRAAELFLQRGQQIGMITDPYRLDFIPSKPS